MNDVTVTPASATKDAAAFGEAFAALPAQVRRHPYRAALLSADHWKSTLQFPVPREVWLAERRGRPLGRVGAALSTTYAATGYVGLFETDVYDPAARVAAGALIDSAIDWLGRHGARRVYGPLDFTTWFSYRFRIGAAADADEHAEAPFAWEPVNPPEYVQWFADRGFTEVRRYASLGFRAEDHALVGLLVAATGVTHDEVCARGYGFRRLDAARLGAELEILHCLSLESFRSNFLFEPIDFAMFSRLYVAASRQPQNSLTYFVLDATGREVGFVFAFIDRGYLVVKTIAVRPDFRDRRLATALTHLVFRDAAERGLQKAISALVAQGNTSEFIAARHEAIRAWRHHYALFERCL